MKAPESFKRAGLALCGQRLSLACSVRPWQASKPHPALGMSRSSWRGHLRGRLASRESACPWVAAQAGEGSAAPGCVPTWKILGNGHVSSVAIVQLMDEPGNLNLKGGLVI